MKWGIVIAALVIAAVVGFTVWNVCSIVETDNRCKDYCKESGGYRAERNSYTDGSTSCLCVREDGTVFGKVWR